MMIGTQMVAKGLDFPRVTLVGVLNADQTLYSDDFRSSERAFDLLTQVVGRSGRGEWAGEAIIQTYTPGKSSVCSGRPAGLPCFLSKRGGPAPCYVVSAFFGFVGVWVYWRTGREGAASQPFLFPPFTAKGGG